VSLISDALRKARQEAARREAIGRGALPPTMSRGAERQRWRAGLVVGAVIALVAAITGGAAVWWAVGRTVQPVDDPRSAAVMPTAGDRASGVPSEPLGPDAAHTAADGQGDHVPRERPSVASAGQGPAPDVAPRSTPSPAAAVLVPPPEPTIAGGGQRLVTDEPAGPRPGTGERVFIAEADLGSVVLSLGYIVFRDTDPFAEINGIEVHEGSMIEGLVVEEIGRHHVLLRDDRGAVRLKVR
jgi:hypothetical protein